MFAGGLSSYLADKADPSEADVEAHAGMEMRLLDNSIRPFVFFQSVADLMSIYWSGKAEEKNSAMQVNSI